MLFLKPCLYCSYFVGRYFKYTTQKKLRVKGNVLIIFVSMSSLV